MPSSADQPISALRTGHDQLVKVAEGLSSAQLTGPSGASEWTIADVLSHLGSGAEIGFAALDAALTGGPAPEPGFNQSVWDRWNALTPPAQAEGFVLANDKLVLRYEGLDERTRNEQQIDLGFLPAPVDVATAAAFRLNEFALHSWDVAVGVDPAAVVARDAVEPLLGIIPFLLGWLGKPAAVLDGRTVAIAVHTTEPDREFGLQLSDSAQLTEPAPESPDAVLTLPGESLLRLLTGRLGADHTPATATVTGVITLDQLRRVFPGF